MPDRPHPTRRNRNPALTPKIQRTRHSIEGYPFVVHDVGAADGPVFLLLHGIGLSHRPYKKLARQLARYGRVVILDLPGFGSTRAPRTTLTVQDYARLIGVLLERLQITSAVTVGHSMGAQFALELAVQRPTHVSHLIMVGPVVDTRRRTAIQQSLALTRDSILEPLTTNIIVFTDYLRAGPRWYLHEVTAMLAYPTLEKIRDFPLPLLILRGAHDPIARESWTHMLVTAARTGTRLSIPRTRHVVIHTAPDKVAQAIMAFTVRSHSRMH